MSALSSLKFVAAKRPTQMPAVQVRRNKLIGKLHHQMLLAKALSEGTQYAPTRFRTVRDRHTGESKSVEMPLRVKSWWFVSENGSVVLQIKYGSKVIDIQKGNQCIPLNPGDTATAEAIVRQRRVIEHQGARQIFPRGVLQLVTQLNRS